MTGIRETREFGDIIDRMEFAIPALADIKLKEQNRVPRFVSASGIKNCSRRWFYDLTGFHALRREERKVAWDLAAYYGDVIHNQIQAELIGYDLIDQPEEYLPRTAHLLSGRVDGQLRARRALLEIKSVNQNAWGGFPNNAKFASYQDQIQIYLDQLDLPEALLICVRREPIVEGKDRKKLRKSLVKEFIVTRDRERGAALLAKVDRIEIARDRLEVPPAEPGDCGFCPYHDICRYHDIAGAVASPATIVFSQEAR